MARPEEVRRLSRETRALWESHAAKGECLEKQTGKSRQQTVVSTCQRMASATGRGSAEKVALQSAGAKKVALQRPS